MRVAYAGEVVIDQFAVWNEDGTEKIPGIVSFTRLTWLNGVSQVVVVAVSEIGTTPGEYMTTFIPPAPGFWKVEVLVPSTGDVFTSTYDVRKRSYTLRMVAVDDRVDVRFALWAELEDGTRSLDFESLAVTLITSAGEEVENLGSQTPNSDGLFVFTVDSGDVVSGSEYLLSVEATFGDLTWDYNLGFSKVA